jgi:hypothetical protein
VPARLLASHLLGSSSLLELQIARSGLAEIRLQASVPGLVDVPAGGDVQLRLATEGVFIFAAAD